MVTNVWNGKSGQPMSEKSSVAADLNWLLDNLVERVVEVRHAVVLSADGLLVARSHGLARDDADQLAAMASAFQGLAKGVGRHFDGGPVRQTIVELERAYVFVTAAGQGACLAVLAGERADMGMVAYEMNLLVKQVGTFLASASRADVAPNGDPGTSP